MGKRHAGAVVLVGDTHCGCRLGLCGPGGFPLDDGGKYEPSGAQSVVWAWWLDFWNKFVPSVVGRDRLTVVLGGDLIEGTHHRATTPISHNIGDQLAIAEEVLKPVAERATGGLYVVRGTEAHVGPSATAEEQLARRLGAKLNEHGQRARYDLRLKLGPWVLHDVHHVGSGCNISTSPGHLARELSDEYTAATQWGTAPPDIVVRHHVHRMGEVRVATARGFGVACSVPAWQLKTPYTWRIRGGRVEPPQIGGLVITYDDKTYQTHWFVRTVGPSQHVNG